MQAHDERTSGTFGMLLRRIAAFTYDSLLILAAFFLVGFAAVALNDGQSVQGAGFYALLWLVAGLFLVIFWANGRTLGMQAWQLRITALDTPLDTPPDAAPNAAPNAAPDSGDGSASGSSRGVASTASPDAPKLSALVVRYVLGTLLFGITLAWMPFDRDRLALHDRLSRTRIVRGSR